MKIGVISDTHDNLHAIEKVISIFQNEGIKDIIHAGDFIAPFSLNPFIGKFNFIGVFGNNDGEKNGLRKKINSIYLPPHKFELYHRKIYLTHVFSPENIEPALLKENDIIIFGHTHERYEKRIDNTLIINPGEVCQWLSNKGSAIILEIDTLTVKFVEF